MYASHRVEGEQTGQARDYSVAGLRWSLLQETPRFVLSRGQLGRLGKGALVAVEVRGTSVVVERVDVREAREVPVEVVVEVKGVGLAREMPVDAKVDEEGEERET